MTTYGDILWTPDRLQLERAQIHHFAKWVGDRVGKTFPDYPSLYEWSITETGAFWESVAIYTGVKWQEKWSSAYEASPKKGMLGARWFVDGKLNYAENLLESWHGEDPNRDILVAYAESAPRRSLTRSSLKEAVARCAQSLKKQGVGPGDRVAGVVTNGPEALIAMLATTSIGAVWASCSPDFGAHAVLDRLGQIEPKILFYADGYHYGGKLCETREAMVEVSRKLPGLSGLVTIPHAGGYESSPVGLETCRIWRWPDFLQQVPNPTALTYAVRKFDDPLFIMFSSGTTGVPKCMVHSVGGTLLQHKKELILHCDLTQKDRLFYFTTCGWMMWNWMVSALSTGASLLVYDGAVHVPSQDFMWRMIREENVSVFGTSPKYISFCMGQDLHPHMLSPSYNKSTGANQAEKEKGSSPDRLKTILVTGSPLMPEQAAWLYREVSPSLHVASISGGTDIISCFMLGHPGLPVRAGEIQCPGLGMAIEAWDDQGLPVRGVKGELVCTKPFPSMPVGFWKDPDGSRYRKAYFDHYLPIGREVWRHGDFVLMTDHGGVIVYGRSDATLNPGGVRIGTAEIYRALEAVHEVLDGVAIGHREGDDTPIILFVTLRPGILLSEALAARIRSTIRRSLTPRHIPKGIIQVQDIPYTRSGKKVEVAVTQAVHGESVGNLSALANPKSMDEFFAFAKQWPLEF